MNVYFDQGKFIFQVQKHLGGLSCSCKTLARIAKFTNPCTIWQNNKTHAELNMEWLQYLLYRNPC